MATTAELDALYRELESMMAAVGIDTTPPDQGLVDAAIPTVERLLAQRHVRLHPQVVWLWRTWPTSAGDLFHPGFTGPDLAAHSLEDDLSPFPFLVTVGYASHQELVADQTHGDREPYLYVRDYVDGQGARLVFASLADLLRYLITIFDQGRSRTDEGPFDLFKERERLSDLLPPSVPDAERRQIGSDATAWPDRWRRAIGLSDDADTLRGATHTVAELVAARGLGPVEATVVGRVKNLGGSGAGTLARLTDETGSIQVLIPSDVPWLGHSPTDTYEIDVVADPLRGRELTMDDFSADRAEVERLASIREIDDAARTSLPLGRHLTGEHPVRAVARRPVR